MGTSFSGKQPKSRVFYTCSVARSAPMQPPFHTFTSVLRIDSCRVILNFASGTYSIGPGGLCVPPSILRIML